MGWIWSESEREYSDTATGDVIGQADLRGHQTALQAKMADRFGATANRLSDAGANPFEWEQEMRQLIDQSHAISYQLGRGGANAMTDADWTTVAGQIEDAYGFAYDFAQEAGTGQLTAVDAEQRARLYADGVRSGFSTGMASAWDVSLPLHPPLHPHCGCVWEMSTKDGSVEARWVVQTGNPCPTCLAAESEYSPFVA